MLLSNRRCLRKGLLLVTLVVVAGAWLVVAMPALAQGDGTPQPSMTQRFFDQPNLAAPLVVPMILALGGVLTLLAFLGWALRRMPENR